MAYHAPLAKKVFCDPVRREHVLLVPNDLLRLRRSGLLSEAHGVSLLLDVFLAHLWERFWEAKGRLGEKDYVIGSDVADGLSDSTRRAIPASSAGPLDAGAKRTDDRYQ